MGVVIYGMNYAPEIAGVGRYTGDIGSHLAAGGHDVRVITTPPHYPGWRSLHGYRAGRWIVERLAGCTLYRCPLFLHPDMAGWRRLLAPLSFALSSAPVALWQILRRRPRVVLVVEPTLFVAPVALLAAKLAGARTVLHVQDLEVEAAFAVGHLSGDGLLKRLATWFDRAATRRFDHVVTISNRMRDRIAAKGVAPSRISVVRNWVDIERVYPVPGASPYRAELGIADDAFVVLYAGNLGAKQGIRLVLEAAERLRDDPRINFVLAGDGPMRPAVEAASQQLSNLRLLPFQPEERFGEFLALAELHVLPQEREAADLVLPSKLGGMLASGRRILVTAEQGTELSDFLGDTCAIVPPGDAARMTEAIQMLAQTPREDRQQAERLGLARQLARRTGLDRFAATLFGDGLDVPGTASKRGQEIGEFALVESKKSTPSA